METIGLNAFCKNAEQYQSLGAMYQPSEALLAKANNNESLF
jgi:hypothetical protein